MAVVVYPTAILPELVNYYIQPYECRDPLLKYLTTHKKRVLAGGTRWRIRLITAPHSDTTAITDANIQVDLSSRSDIGYVEGDWPYLMRPILMHHKDRARMNSKGEYKRFLDERTRATMADMNNSMRRRMYNGGYRINEGAWLGLSSLNGSNTSGTSYGLENGLLQFVVPASQTGTYLGKTRNVDTVFDFDNWYNQYADHPGLGAGALEIFQELKDIADDYCPEGESGIRFGVCSRASKRKLGAEVRAYPGGVAPSLVYTVADIENGKAIPSVETAAGITFYANRYFTDAAIGAGIDEAFMLLNPDYIEWQVNEDMDYKTTATVDLLLTMGKAMDMAIVKHQVQLAATMLHVHAASKHA